MADKTSIMKEAQKYLAKGQIDKAITEWGKLLKESPDGNTYNVIGDLYLKKGDKKIAIEYLHKAANFFRHEGFSLKALALYKKVLNINSNDIDSLYTLGELNEEKGLINDAIKYYLATADSMVKIGKKDQILDIYEKILSLSPSNIPLRNKVAEIFLKEGLKSDAAKEYIQIARLYDEKGDIQNSKGYYQKVLDFQPSNKDAIFGINYLYEKTGNIDKAIDNMREVSTLFPEDADVILRCAELSLIKGNTDDAKDYLKKITAKEPTNIKCRRLLGEIYFKDGLKEKAWAEYLPVLDDMILDEKYEDAIKLLKSFKGIDPIETGKRLISLYRQLDETEQVVAELKSLGDVFSERGMDNEAQAFYSEAIEITPDDEYLRGKLAEIATEPEIEKEVVTGPEIEKKFIQEPEVERDAVTEDVSIIGDKTVGEIFTEADIFSRYGLLNEAIKLLEGMKVKEPDNIELHIRLKSIYLESSDKELAITECLILNELYKRIGDNDNAEKSLKDACEINPEDPRLTEVAKASLLEPKSYDFPTREEFADTTTKIPDIEDYQEEITEADFYVRQGLIQEAVKILEKLHTIFPDEKMINERLSNLGQITEVPETSEIPETVEIPEETYEMPEMALEDNATFDAVHEKEIKEEITQPSETVEIEDFVFTEQDLVEAEEIPEPELDNDVLEIFQEFKKGLEKELGEEDSETHYNLGIAYKEMGLIDDAIKEFQTARNDPKRLNQSLTMLGVCYMEKGLYSLAIDVFSSAIKDIDNKDESCWALKYDLAEAYEKNNNLKEALDLYTEVYGWNAKFRNVSERINQVNTQIDKGGEVQRPKGRKDRVSYL